MKEYKVETLVFFSKISLDSKEIAKRSNKEIQHKLNEYASKGYRLVSTDTSDFGIGFYVYLYFEK